MQDFDPLADIFFASTVLHEIKDAVGWREESQVEGGRPADDSVCGELVQL